VRTRRASDSTWLCSLLIYWDFFFVTRCRNETFVGSTVSRGWLARVAREWPSIRDDTKLERLSHARKPIDFACLEFAMNHLQEETWINKCYIDRSDKFTKVDVPNDGIIDKNPLNSSFFSARMSFICLVICRREIRGGDARRTLNVRFIMLKKNVHARHVKSRRWKYDKLRRYRRIRNVIRQVLKQSHGNHRMYDYEDDD